MAQILAVAFFNSPEEGKNFWPLLEPLPSQNHHVTLLTNSNFVPPSNKDIEIWGLLDKGSIRDTFRLISPLLSKQFDIVHFFHFSKNPPPIHHMLFWFFSQQPHVVMASSLMTDKMEITKSSLLKLWFQQSDIVTGFSRSMLAEMRTIRPKAHRQSKIALPPMIASVTSNETNHWSRADEEFLEEAAKKRRILVPFFPAKRKKTDEFWTTFLNIVRSENAVFLGSKKQWPLKERKEFLRWLKESEISNEWLLTGENDQKFHANLVQNTSAVWLAGLPITSFEVVYWLSSAFSHRKPVIVDAAQARLYPELLRSGQNWCMVLPSNSNDWPSQWAEHEKELQAPPDWMDLQMHADSRINDLSRLYQRAIEDRT